MMTYRYIAIGYMLNCHMTYLMMNSGTNSIPMYSAIPYTRGMIVV